ncbi:uncharacterized protein BX664DRAFT_388014 [Halteromyces radiatus]|uniref:uncharacterized protein n=1 Tax=Halteromyces radiatus TaxID=101107 RepID=UPI002220C276|nr:uncharacterized protein BX664DRAFT_388014 [Halteromyces radiatus]KAI8082884.1 hypothetical protein BX664DRAFT_388014 [Halteromyces radiatus]
MHRTSGLMTSTTTTTTTMMSPIAVPLMTDSPNYPLTVPTPPPSASPVDLPPIPELSSYGRHLTLDDGPPSPASPKKQKDALPAYLEPTPQACEVNATLNIRPQLFHLLAPPLVIFPTRRATAPALTNHPSIYTPLPRRSQSQSMDSIHTSENISMDPYTPSSISSSPISVHQQENNHHRNSTKKRKIHHTSPFQGQDSCTSPTLAAACASAANLHTSTTSSPTSTPSSPSISQYVDLSRVKSDDDKKLADQSMFLTKNAHIKRPRNAWIHFRCHYGQALKTQDPTLRAEEISKRASRRWSLLSENEKRPWHQLAEQEKQAHKEAFPEYRYCPKRASSSSTNRNSPLSSIINNNNNNNNNTSINQLHPPSMASSGLPLPQQGLYRLSRLATDLDSVRTHKKSKKMM